MYLTPIEQAIVDWNIAHPVELVVFCVVFAIASIAFVVWVTCTESKNEQLRISAERANKRAWIKERNKKLYHM